MYISLSRINLSRNLVSDYTELFVFLSQYMIEKMLLPGKVEKWAIFIDMGNEWLQ